MSRILETICLTKKQIKTVLENLWTIRKLKFSEIIYEGKPTFSKEIKDTYGYKNYTKFADNYVIYKCKSLVDNHNEIFITVESDHYDKQNILAISGFEHIVKDYLKESCLYHRPTINVCLCFVVAKTMKQHIPTEIFVANCFMRIFSLCSLYPVIGSTSTLYTGLTYDYEILESEKNEKAYNGKSFPIVLANDPMVIALNAVEGELICYKRIIHDVAVYSEYQIRIVKNKVSSLSTVSKGGIPPPIPQNILSVNN